MERKILTIFICLIFFSATIPIYSSTDIENQDPSIPTIDGPSKAKIGEKCTYIVKSIDPQEEDLFYIFKCSDDPGYVIELGPFKSGLEVTFSPCWCDDYQQSNPFRLRVKAKDIFGHESEWGIFDTKITNKKIKNSNIVNNDKVPIHSNSIEKWLKGINGYIGYAIDYVETSNNITLQFTGLGFGYNTIHSYNSERYCFLPIFGSYIEIIINGQLKFDKPLPKYFGKINTTFIFCLFSVD